MWESTLPDIRAQLVERFVFNFSVPPEILAQHLPPWLIPQVFGNAAVASFCVLDLAGVTFGPIPASLDLRNIHSAHRFGVLDAQSQEEGVFVDERNTNSRVGSFLSSLGFPGHHKYVDASIEKRDELWHVDVCDDQESPLFSATVERGSSFSSDLFPDLRAFTEFIAHGVRSYCPAVRGGYTVVDLEKDDSVFEPLQVRSVSDRLMAEWLGLPMSLPLDSAVRTTGGTYVWRYRGRRKAEGTPERGG